MGVSHWSVKGRTRHVEVKQKIMFLRELKEGGLIDTNWIPGKKITSDIFTKNLQSPLFNKHARYKVRRRRLIHEDEKLITTRTLSQATKDKPLMTLKERVSQSD